MYTTVPSKSQPGTPTSSHLLNWGRLAAAHLLSLKVLIQEEERGLVGFGGSHDGEHALARVVVGSLVFLVSSSRYPCVCRKVILW